jgi:hypothetical protein
MIGNFVAVPGLSYPSVSSSTVGEEPAGESGETNRWLGYLCR